MQTYVSDFIGLPLLTRGGERIGYVKNVQTDKNMTRVRNLECCDEEEEEFILPVSAVASFGKDAAVVKGVQAKGCKNCLPAPFGVAVFSKDGEQLGSVCDFEREDMLIRNLILSDKTSVSVERICGLTDAIMVDLSENFVRKTACRTRTKRQPPAANEPSGECAAGQEKAAENTEQTPQSPSLSETEETQILTARAAVSPQRNETDAEQDDSQTKADECANMPRRKMAGRGLLTGKILPQDLIDARGNAIARAGTAVSADTIRRALQHNKLFELTLLCCGNDPYNR